MMDAIKKCPVCSGTGTEEYIYLSDFGEAMKAQRTCSACGLTQENLRNIIRELNNKGIE